MTARIPDEARNSKFMFRFMQANHTCYCATYVTNVKVESGGLPIAMIAEQEFELYGDGKLIGHGNGLNRPRCRLGLRWVLKRLQ